MIALKPGNLPVFGDDLSQDSLQAALFESIEYFKQIPPNQTFSYANRSVSASEQIDSLGSFSGFFKKTASPRLRGRWIRKNYDIYMATGLNGSGEFLVTGYFEPTLKASLTRDPPFLYPLYRFPSDMIMPSLGKKNPMVPFWTRAEIEKSNCLAGRELLYLADPIDVFFLHVQGSGRVKFPDNIPRRVHFAGSNGRAYRSIGKLLIEEGKMKPEDVNLRTIREYLAEHPDDRDRILHYNERYIFFDMGKIHGDEGPLGSLGKPLTSGRSAAMDVNCFPPGGLLYITSSKPVVDPEGNVTGWEPMARFMLNQDTGAAITGSGRIDIFWGADRYAEIAAGMMKHPGKVYFLIKKRKEIGAGSHSRTDL